jgi:hypothetical protein
MPIIQRNFIILGYILRYILHVFDTDNNRKISNNKSVFILKSMGFSILTVSRIAMEWRFAGIPHFLVAEP